MTYAILFAAVFCIAWAVLMFKGSRFLLLPLWARLSLGLGLWSILAFLIFLARARGDG